MATNLALATVSHLHLRIRVVRALPGGRFEKEYDGIFRGSRVDARIAVERMQDEFDREGDPLRAYICKDGVPLEAAYCLREARS